MISAIERSDSAAGPIRRAAASRSGTPSLPLGRAGLCGPGGTPARAGARQPVAAGLVGGGEPGAPAGPGGDGAGGAAGGGDAGGVPVAVLVGLGGGEEDLDPGAVGVLGDIGEGQRGELGAAQRGGVADQDQRGVPGGGRVVLGVQPGDHGLDLLGQRGRDAAGWGDAGVAADPGEHVEHPRVPGRARVAGGAVVHRDRGEVPGDRPGRQALAARTPPPPPPSRPGRRVRRGARPGRGGRRRARRSAGRRAAPRGPRSTHQSRKRVQSSA